MPTKTKSEEKQMADMRSLLKKGVFVRCEPRSLLLDLYKVVEKYNANNDDLEKYQEFLKKSNEALPVVGLDTHYILAESVIESIRPFVIDFAHQLITEYNCTTPAEKALAEVVTASYARVLQFTKVMTRQVRDERCSDILNNFYRVASQELDRANRHFTTALTTLRQLKSPAMTVQVKARNAFVAQNQQINASSSNVSTENEKEEYENVNPT